MTRRDMNRRGFFGAALGAIAAMHSPPPPIFVKLAKNSVYGKLRGAGIRLPASGKVVYCDSDGIVVTVVRPRYQSGRFEGKVVG